MKHTKGESKTYGDLWEENQDINIFDPPDHLKREGFVGKVTHVYAEGYQNRIVEVEYHEDGGMFVLSEHLE